VGRRRQRGGRGALAGDPGLRSRQGERSRDLAAPWGYETSVQSVLDLLESLPQGRRYGSA